MMVTMMSTTNLIRVAQGQQANKWGKPNFELRQLDQCLSYPNLRKQNEDEK